MAETGQSIKPTDLRPGSEGYQKYITGEHWFENQGKEAPQSASSIETAIGNAITPLRTEISQVTGKVEEMTRQQLEVVANLQGQVAELQKQVVELQKQVAVIPQLQEEVKLLREQLTSQVTSTEKTEAQKPKTKAAATSIPNEEEIQKDIADGLYTEADIRIRDGSRRVADNVLARRIRQFRASATQQRQEAVQPEPPQTEAAPAAEKLAEDDKIGPQSEIQETAEPTPDAAGEEIPEDEEAGEQKEGLKKPTIIHAGDFQALYTAALANNKTAYLEASQLRKAGQISTEEFYTILQKDCGVQFKDHDKTELSSAQSAWKTTVMQGAKELNVTLSNEQILKIAKTMTKSGGDYKAAIREAAGLTATKKTAPSSATKPTQDEEPLTAELAAPEPTQDQQSAPETPADAAQKRAVLAPSTTPQIYAVDDTRLELTSEQINILKDAGVQALTDTQYHEAFDMLDRAQTKEDLTRYILQVLQPPTIGPSQVDASKPAGMTADSPPESAEDDDLGKNEPINAYPFFNEARLNALKQLGVNELTASQALAIQQFFELADNKNLTSEQILKRLPKVLQKLGLINEEPQPA